MEVLGPKFVTDSESNISTYSANYTQYEDNITSVGDRSAPSPTSKSGYSLSSQLQNDERGEVRSPNEFSRASWTVRSPNSRSRISRTRSIGGSSHGSVGPTRKAQFVRSVIKHDDEKIEKDETGENVVDDDEVDGPEKGDADEMSESDLSDDDGRDEERPESDYDTDLEMDPDKWLFPEKYEHDTTGRYKYIKACHESGVQPVKCFLRNMQEDLLNLRHHGLGPVAMRTLAIPLESNTSIEVMDLEGNFIMAEGTGHLCRVLRENVFVSRLNLAENQIGNEGAMRVCNLLMTNKHIDHLNLAGNGIGNATIESFYNVLSQTRSSLKHLDLSHNTFDDSSAQRFKDIFLENETLEVFDISWNHFQSKGCVLLAEGLAENVGLKELAVSMNGFGLEGGKALGKALQSNRTLLRLEASYCRLPTDSCTAIALGLMNTDKLTVLDLSNNCFDTDSALVLLAGVQRNESSELLFFNLGNTRVNHKFKELQIQLGNERGLVIHHGGVNEDYKTLMTELDPMEAFKRDPMTMLKDWIASAGYRIVDLFRHFDKDGSMSISVKEFQQGIASTKIPLTEEQTKMLISRLDKDGDGEIDFSELLEGDKTHRANKREIVKYMMEKEEKDKERENIEKEKELLFPTLFESGKAS